MLPLLARGRMIPDLFAILGAMDFVLATWIDEERTLMLTAEERQEIEGELGTIPPSSCVHRRHEDRTAPSGLGLRRKSSRHWRTARDVVCRSGWVATFYNLSSESR